jgi:hypothetical protein
MWSMPLYKDCKCNYAGQGYCDLFPGDAPFQAFLSRVSHYITAHTRGCHTLRRFSEDCLKVTRKSGNIKRFMKSYYKVHDFPKIQEISTCARDMFQPQVALDAGLVLGTVLAVLAWAL